MPPTLTLPKSLMKASAYNRSVVDQISIRETVDNYFDTASSRQG